MITLRLKRWRRLLPIIVLLATSAASGAQSLQWVRIENGCRTLVQAPSAPVFGCGAYGAFVFGDPAAEIDVDPACGLAAGSEEPARYHSEAPAPSASPAGWVPCSGGSCFESPQTDRPWVAVLDWNDGHGWSVGETLLEASDRAVAVSLYDLFGARDLLPALGPRVTDVDVLVQLCAIAEEVDRAPERRPVAVNMSFGRVPRGGAPCGGPVGGGIECEVRGVLDHLYYDLGVVPVAAAGNHSELLFPASHPTVLSAGALDLAYFIARDRQVEASMETPVQAEALVLGYGLYLQNPGAIADLWPAPAGSSYSSAMVAGWIAGSLGKDESFRGRGYDTSGRWQPIADRSLYELAFDGRAVPGSALSGPSSMLTRATGEHLLPACSAAPVDAYREVAVGGLAPELPTLSVVDLETDGGPLPGSRPCIPCEGEEPPPPPPTLSAPHGDLLVDLRASAPLPEGLELRQLYLRAGRRVYRLEPLEGPVDELHEAFAAGRIPRLLVTGLLEVAGPEEQLSLVFTVRAGAESPEAWDAVPISVRHLDGGSPCDGLGLHRPP